MSYYFDNNNRYQIIYPFTSEKIHVASNISTGAEKCYQEIKEKNIVTPVFIVHEIDQGNMYYFDIPKYKNQNPTNNFHQTNTQNNPQNTYPDIAQRPIKLLQDNVIVHNPMNENNKMNQLHHYDALITRLNNVEYELDLMKKSLAQNQKIEKDEELSCSIL